MRALSHIARAALMTVPSMAFGLVLGLLNPWLEAWDEYRRGR